MSETKMVVDRMEIGGSHQPFLVEGARLYGFVFKGDDASLQALCDRHLNNPSGGKKVYKPFGAFVVVTFAHLSKIVPETEPYSQIGWASETEAAIWIVTPSSFLGLIPLPAFFIPYIFVDLPLAITQGREIFGYPKEMGWFPPRDWHAPDPWNADEFTVDAFGLEQLSPNPWRRQPLLTVTRAPYEATPPERSWVSFDEAAAAIVDSLEGSDGVGSLDALRQHHFWPPIGKSVFLKQFAAAEDGRYACYQAIVEQSFAPVGGLNGFFLGGDYRLRLHPLAANSTSSHPLLRHLGVSDGDKSLVSYWMDFSFRGDAGKVVWT